MVLYWKVISKGRISRCFYQGLKEYEIARIYVRRVMQEDIPADKDRVRNEQNRVRCQIYFNQSKVIE